jgi:hypothetical protein
MMMTGAQMTTTFPSKRFSPQHQTKRWKETMSYRFSQSFPLQDCLELMPMKSFVCGVEESYTYRGVKC